MRKIAVVTGSRAEYGLLYWVIQEILQDKDCTLQLYVTGMHLSPEFGYTAKTIEADGVPITARVEMLLSSDTPVGISKSIGLGVIGFADVLAQHTPDIMVVLGDRFETFAAVVAALNARIPVAHCHGGEITEGAVDEALRHAITKMAHLHFVSTPEYARRVGQLGENPDHIYHVGALGLENMRRKPLLSKTALEQAIGFQWGAPTFMVTFHPTTLENNTSEMQFQALLRGLDAFPEARIVFTKPNADADGRVIIKLIDDYVAKQNGRCVAFTSMGWLNYLSALQYADVVIGNSSSGIIEAPSFRKATVNIGDRQKGRVKPGSVIDCEPEEASIRGAISKALSAEFKEHLTTVNNPYDGGDPAKRIVQTLKEIPLNSIIKKKFFDQTP